MDGKQIVDFASDYEDRDDEQASDLPMEDENAFGIWLSWFDAEEVEYSQSADKFPPRLMVFRSAVQDYLGQNSPGSNAIAIDMGTSVYVEIADGDHKVDPFAWLKGLRTYLSQGDWTTFGVITHGGRWVTSKPGATMPSKVGDVQVMASFGPSEPMRKAMAAESMSHDDEDGDFEGWGPGLFVDEEALDAMNRKLKNEPTALRCAGACFFRIGA